MIFTGISLLFCAAATWAWGRVFKRFAIPLYLSFVAASITFVLIFLSIMMALNMQTARLELDDGFCSMIGIIIFYAAPFLLLTCALSAFVLGHFKR